MLKIENPAIGLSNPASSFALNRGFAALYEKGKQQQWNGATDLDWGIESCFGSDLPRDSSFALACFENSPMAPYGRAMWDSFRWEFHSWMVSQFLSGEQAALTAACRLVELAPDFDLRLCLAGQVVDEARHLEVFSRYLSERVPAPYPVSPSFGALLRNTLSDNRWDVIALGTHILVETQALAAFRVADRTFHDNLIREICRRAAQDEARHVSLGVLSLRSLYVDMTETELKYREQFVEEALNLVRQEFMLEEIWDRMSFPPEKGAVFANTNELLIEYRQIICSKLVTGLVNIGLMTRRLRDRLIQLNLLGSQHRAVTDAILRELAHTSVR